MGTWGGWGPTQPTILPIYSNHRPIPYDMAMATDQHQPSIKQRSIINVPLDNSLICCMS